MRRWIKGLIIAAACAAVAAGGWYYASGQRPAFERRSAVSPTVSIPVQRATLTRSLSFSGKLSPVRQATLTAPAATRVVEVGASDGAFVREGELIVAFDDTQARLSYLQAQRDYEQSRLEATPAVIEEKLISLDLARRNYEATKITAPFSGVVSGLTLRPGDAVSNGATVAKLIDLSSYQVTVDISERDLGYISPGQTVYVTVTALPGLRLTGRVERVGWEPSSSGDVVTYPVTVVIDDAPSSLRPGMSAQVDIVIQEARDVLAVPLEAVAEAGPLAFVTRVTPQGGEEVVQVTTGMSDGRYVEIRSGLAEGDRILVNNYALYQTLFEGDAPQAAAAIRGAVQAGRFAGGPGGFAPAAPVAAPGIAIRGGGGS